MFQLATSDRGNALVPALFSDFGVLFLIFQIEEEKKVMNETQVLTLLRIESCNHRRFGIRNLVTDSGIMTYVINLEQGLT